jgi:hypothetical protein
MLVFYFMSFLALGFFIKVIIYLFFCWSEYFEKLLNFDSGYIAGFILGPIPENKIPEFWRKLANTLYYLGWIGLISSFFD